MEQQGCTSGPRLFTGCGRTAGSSAGWLPQHSEPVPKRHRTIFKRFGGISIPAEKAALTLMLGESGRALSRMSLVFLS